MELKTTTTHLIINFNVSNERGELMVDLVPKNWVYLDIHGYIYCKYPDENDYFKVKKWSKENAYSKQYWKSYEVVIISKASSYKQGLRRLRRSYNCDQIASSNFDRSSSSSSSTTESEEEEIS